MTRRILPYVIVVAFAAVIVSFLVYTQQMARAIRMDATVFSRIYALTFHPTSELSGVPIWWADSLAIADQMRSRSPRRDARTSQAPPATRTKGRRWVSISVSGRWRPCRRERLWT